MDDVVTMLNAMKHALPWKGYPENNGVIMS